MRLALKHPAITPEDARLQFIYQQGACESQATDNAFSSSIQAHHGHNRCHDTLHAPPPGRADDGGVAGGITVRNISRLDD